MQTAQQLADLLIGSNKSILDVCTDEEFENMELMRALDELAFECEDCSWWCDISEMRDSMLCDECSPDND